MENVLQVVGYQNSGKTTLMTKLITQAAENGLRVASIKHHGHGGSPDMKDSVRHQQAGAMIAGVEGNGLLQLNIQRDGWPLNDILSLYHTFSVDLILVEGFKKEGYPKVVLIRTEEDLPLLELEAIQCIISRVPLNELPYPVFRFQEEEQYLPFIIERLLKL